MFLNNKQSISNRWKKEGSYFQKSSVLPANVTVILVQSSEFLFNCSNSCVLSTILRKAASCSEIKLKETESYGKWWSVSAV